MITIVDYDTWFMFKVIVPSIIIGGIILFVIIISTINGAKEAHEHNKKFKSEESTDWFKDNFPQ